jgi:D-amino peptidase
MFIGYHARVGSQNGILDHTWSSSAIGNVWLNGQLMGETGVNAAVCGRFGVPVILISGDQTVCAEATDLLGPIETVVVKQASGRMAAECLSPEVAQHKIYEAARLAASRFCAGQAPQPLRIQTPVTLTVDLVNSEMADRLELLQSARRLEGKRIEIVAEDMLIAYRLLRAAAVLARG